MSAGRAPPAAPSNPRPSVSNMSHPPMNRATMVVPRMPMVQAVPVGMQGMAGMVRNFPPGLVPAPTSGSSGSGGQPPRPGQHPVMAQPTPFYQFPAGMPAAMNAMFPCMPVPSSMPGGTMPVPNMKVGNGQPIGQPLKVPLT